MSKESEENRVSYYCPKCGAGDDHLQHDAIVKWLPVKQEWEVFNALDSAYCTKCEVELNRVNVDIRKEGDKVLETPYVVPAHGKISISRQHETAEERLLRILRSVESYVQMGTSHIFDPSEVPELKEYYDTIHPDTKS